jgi:hypothetical protein
VEAALEINRGGTKNNSIFLRQTAGQNCTVNIANKFIETLVELNIWEGK